MRLAVHPFRKVSLVAIGLLFIHPALAWSPDGHRTVGTLAEKLISGTSADAQVRALLGADLTLADAAVWADCAKGVNATTFKYERAGRYPECAVFETPDGVAQMEDFVRRNVGNCIVKPGGEVCHKQYHYADVDIRHSEYRRALAGTRDDDIVAAIVATTRVLNGKPAPAPFNIKDRREALFLLAHYLGDIHQPLHIGAVYLSATGQRVNPDAQFDTATETHGGNSIDTDSGNLHSVWDAIPQSMFMEHVDAAWIEKARAVLPTPGALEEWPAKWATDSLIAARVVFEGLTFGARSEGRWRTNLPPGYLMRASQMKQTQLTAAGAHLAQVLVAVSSATTEPPRADLRRPGRRV
jgi:hypothetical protein